MHLFRVVCSWAGPQVKGNAVTVLHFDGSNQTAPPVAAIFNAFVAAKALFPLNASITVPNTGDIIEDTTGALTGTWTGTGGNAVAFSGQTGAAAGVGACIGWTTGAIVQGTKGPRRLRGRTFLVPLHKDAYDADGTIDNGSRATLQTLADNIMGAGGLSIWHRPTTVGGSDGTSAAVLSGLVKDHVAYLSSRRD